MAGQIRCRPTLPYKKDFRLVSVVTSHISGQVNDFENTLGNTHYILWSTNSDKGFFASSEVGKK